MNKEKMLLGIDKELRQSIKDEDKYFVRGIIYFVLAIIFGLISFFSFVFLFSQFNVFYVIGLVAGIIATSAWVYEADAHFSESNEIGKYKETMKTAIWIVNYWVEEKQLNRDFYKYVKTEFDDDYDRALSFLKDRYNIDT